MTRTETKTDTQTPPPGWPEGVPLPTIAEAEEAVRKVGKMIEEGKKKNHIGQKPDEPDIERITINI